MRDAAHALAAPDARVRVPDAARAVPRVDQFFGVWAMHNAPGFAAAMNRTDWLAHISAFKDDGPAVREAGPLFTTVMVSGVAVALVTLDGVLTKYGSSVTAGVLDFRRALRAAAADPRVDAVVIRIDSPGGSVSGIDDAAADVRAAAARKPVHAFVEDLGASGAYWIASQAQRITVNPNGLIGAIGTYAVVRDESAKAAADGVAVHVVRAGEYKGAATPGTPVTAAHLAEFQRVVDETNAVFLSAVALGRGLAGDDLAAVTDGRIHHAKSAVAMGLADAVGTFESVLDAAAATAAAPAPAPHATPETRTMPIARNRSTAAPASTAPAAATPDDDKPTPPAAPAAPEAPADPAPDDEETPGAAAPADPDAPADDDDETERANKPAAAFSASGPATLPQLREAFPTSTAEWRERVAIAGLTLAQARAMAADATAFGPPPAAPVSPGRRPHAVAGAAPLPAGHSADSGGNAREEVDRRVSERMAAMRCPRHTAMRDVLTADPALHRRFVAEHNAAHTEARAQLANR